MASRPCDVYLRGLIANRHEIMKSLATVFAAIVVCLGFSNMGLGQVVKPVSAVLQSTVPSVTNLSVHDSSGSIVAQVARDRAVKVEISRTPPTCCECSRSGCDCRNKCCCDGCCCKCRGPWRWRLFPVLDDSFHKKYPGLSWQPDDPGSIILRGWTEMGVTLNAAMFS